MKTVWLYCILLLCTLPCKAQNLEFEAINDIPGAYITSIQELSTGDIIITTPQGVWSGNSALSEWKKISSGIADSTILCSAIGINNTIFVGTPTGVYKSSNQGLQWIKTGNNFSSKEVRHLSVHPNGTVYAGVNKRLYRSKDNGSTWQIFADSVMKLYTSKAQHGIVHYGAGGRLIVMTHYSDDDGKSWKTNITNNSYVIPNNEGGEGNILSYTVAENGYIYFSCSDTSQSPSGVPGHFMVSTDNGTNWAISGYNVGKENGYTESNTKEQYHNFLYMNSKESELKMVGLENDTLLFFPYQGTPIFVRMLVINNNDILFTELQYFTRKIEGLTSTEVMCAKKLRNGRLIVGTYGGGLFYSDNKGLKWNKVQLPIYYPILTCYDRNEVFQKSYLGTTNGLFEYDKVQKSWNEIALKDSNSKFIRDIAIRPTDGALFVLVREGIYQRVGDSWKNIYSHVDNYTCKDMLFYGDTMMISANSSSFYSTNFTIWKKYIVHAQESTGGGFFIYYNKKNSYPFSVNGGYIEYYSKIYGNIQVKAGLPVFRFSDDKEKKFFAFVFAVTEGNTNDDFYIGNEAGVFKLDLLSNAWLQDKKTGLTKDRVLALASNQTGEVFAGALTGAFRSTDKALTWIGLPQFPTKAVRSLAIDHEGYIYAGLAWGGIYKSKQSSVQLSAPELTNPAHKSTGIKLKSDANWKTVKYATGYHIQIAEDSLFVTPIVNDSTLGVNVKPLNGLLLPNTLYYWRARATFGNFRGEWSTTNSFTTETILPEKLQLQKPTDKSPNVSVTPLLQWSKSIQSQAYHVQVSRKQDFSQQETEDSTLTTAEKNITNLEVGTNYYWRVRGKNKAGYGLWSDIWSFTTKQGTNSVYDNRENNGLSFSLEGEELTIRNNPYNHTQSVLIITDLIGQKVVSIPLERGTKTQTLTIGKLQKGFYNVSLQSDSGTISKSIIVP